MKHVRGSLSAQKITWLNIVGANKEDVAYLKSKFKFIELDLDEALAHRHAQRPKVVFRPHYVFVVFLFPVYNPRTKRVTHTEVDFFITSDHVITLHYDVTHNLNNFFDELAKDAKKRQTYFSDSPALFLYELLRHIYITKYPILDAISADIDRVEENLYGRNERALITEILNVKRNIVNFKKTMLSHHTLIEQLRDFHGTYWHGGPDVHEFYGRLQRHVRQIGETLANYYETVNALEDTNNALVTFKLNDIMRTLTVFSVIVFPLTLFAAIFGMNTKYIPIVGSPFDFWIIISIMGLLSVGMYFYFKKKDWL